MSVCYLVMAHDRPEETALLCRALAGDGLPVSFVVHFDAKAGELPRQIHWPDNTFFVERRHDVSWGGISQVEALIETCITALQKAPADMYVLLSGADCPVKSADYIAGFLEAHKDMDFIQCRRLLTDECPWPERGRRRLDAYALPLSRRRIATIEPRRLNRANLRQFAKVALTSPSKLPAAIGMLTMPRRRFPEDLAPYGGEFWWMLSHATLSRALTSDYSQLLDFLKDTNNPDEMFFNTVVGNMVGVQRSSDLKRYISWDGRHTSPRWLGTADAELLTQLSRNPDVLFARKLLPSVGLPLISREL